MSFIEELKRRNVFRVGIAYAVSSWVILQVADIVLENTDAPGWIMDVIMLFIVLGFLIALILAWAFEITPEGIKREQDVDRSASMAQETGRKLDWITLAAALFVGVLFLIDRLEQRAPVAPPSVNAMPVETTSEETGEGVAPPELDDLPSAPAAGNANEPVLGVAVLPLENLSTDQANAFFAGGVHEDVLSHVALIQGLRVISRTSMLRVAERNLSIPAIGQALGVSHVVAGSVRRADDQVRVTIQLIDALTEEQLWGATYDRKLDDIFKIQSEIAREIAAQLKTKLSPAERDAIEAIPTNNMLAYDYYLKAREKNLIWRGAEGFANQRELLEQALAIDPEFLEARVMLANALGRLVWTESDPQGVYRQQARELTESIQAEHPASYHARRARADYRYTVMRDYDQAAIDYRGLVEQEPNEIELWLYLSASYKRTNRYEEALEALQFAAHLDPENPQIPAEMVFSLQGLGRVEEAITLLQEALARFPEDESLRSTLAGSLLVYYGDLESYRALRPDRFGSSGSLEADRIGFVDDFEMRLGLVEFGLDAVTAVLEEARLDADAWGQLRIDLASAELHNLAGEEETSVRLASAVMDRLRQRLADRLPFPSTLSRYYFSMFAYAACLANDAVAAAYLRGIVEALPVDDESLLQRVELNLLLAQAECGDIEGAWSQLSSFDDVFSFASNGGDQTWGLVVDPIFAHYFADLPAYDALQERFHRVPK